MVDPTELAAWLQLIRSPGLRAESARRLLAAFGSAPAVLAAGAGAWREVGGALAAQALLTPPPVGLDDLVDRSLRWHEANPAHHHLVTLDDPAYPPLLLQTADPPFLLFAQGDLGWLGKPALAVVGSRHATPQGLDNAQAFAAHLSQAGLTIISGLALGIDGAAHEGGLSGRGGTIAVIGTGPDQVYPRRHQALAARIVEHGLILGELPPGAPPLAQHFPRRNRIIAGLSLGTLVVEAAVQSGSLITARLALECNREVFAVPGSIHAPQARGCHLLIKQGAKLVETADDILSELPQAASAAAPDATATPDSAVSEDPGASPAKPLLRALGHDPVTLDALGARTGWPVAELQAALLDLELAGQVGRLPGGLFQRLGRA
jgi:DNA processing protein